MVPSFWQWPPSMQGFRDPDSTFPVTLPFPRASLLSAPGQQKRRQSREETYLLFKSFGSVAYRSHPLTLDCWEPVPYPWLDSRRLETQTLPEQPLASCTCVWWRVWMDLVVHFSGLLCHTCTGRGWGLQSMVRIGQKILCSVTIASLNHSSVWGYLHPCMCPKAVPCFSLSYPSCFEGKLKGNNAHLINPCVRHCARRFTCNPDNTYFLWVTTKAVALCLWNLYSLWERHSMWGSF